MKERKFGTYLVYATGEILLIIVGILAALWIDGWNQDRQEAKREAFYLEGLKHEFQLSLAKLDTLIAVNKRTYNNTKELLSRLPEVETRDEEAALSGLLIEALSYEIQYNPNNSLLREMINSGRLQILSDADLRQRLTSWEPSLESANRQESNLRNIREQVMDVFLGPEGSILSILQDAGVASIYVGEGIPKREHTNLPVLKSQEFENKLVVFLITAEGTESNFYLPLRKGILTILERIDASLGSASR
ncbi:DUF6090 family protein [Robiginitalea sediminis]|uniref:DUF6090 family protein n=1 Tax=Robiginitalea sediminis TaxID=1982593 RepID=UPI00117B5293|nr:DUF6090 family protein [Robiginitalea sediminis]